MVEEPKSQTRDPEATLVSTASGSGYQLSNAQGRRQLSEPRNQTYWREARTRLGLCGRSCLVEGKSLQARQPNEERQEAHPDSCTHPCPSRLHIGPT